MSRWNDIKERVATAAYRADRMLSKADSLAQVVALAAAARSPLAYIGVALAGARFLAGALDQGASAKAWHTPAIPPSLCTLVAEALGLVPGSKDRDRTTLAGVTVVAFNATTAVTIQTECDAPGLHDALMGALAAHVRRVAQHVQLGGSSGLPHFAPGDMEDDPESEAADAVWARQVGFLRAGKTRCVLLSGPPRSGKSTVARVLARKVAEEWPGATSMRVPVADLNAIGAPVVGEVLSCVRPDVFIVDDLERAADEAGLLEMLERCHDAWGQRLVVVTCNDPKLLSPAVRGPGRVEDVEVISGAGEALAARVLADTRPDLAPRVASWPVKYVAELADRIRHVPGIDVDAELAELEARVKEAMG